jgi:hypothetical protein
LLLQRYAYPLVIISFDFRILNGQLHAVNGHLHAVSHTTPHMRSPHLKEPILIQTLQNAQPSTRSPTIIPTPWPAGLEGTVRNHYVDSGTSTICCSEGGFHLMHRSRVLFVIGLWVWLEASRLNCFGLRVGSLIAGSRCCCACSCTVEYSMDSVDNKVDGRGSLMQLKQRKGPCESRDHVRSSPNA